MNKEANIDFEKKILNLIKNNMRGFKRTGLAGGALVGSGTGGTIGFMKAIDRQNEGEMDNLSTKEKIKEYIKEILPRAGVGAAIGGGTGLGAFAAYKNLISKKYTNNLLKGIKSNPEVYTDPELQKNILDVIKSNPDEYGMDMVKTVKNKMFQSK